MLQRIKFLRTRPLPSHRSDGDKEPGPDLRVRAEYSGQHDDRLSCAEFRALAFVVDDESGMAIATTQWKLEFAGAVCRARADDNNGLARAGARPRPGPGHRQGSSDLWISPRGQLQGTAFLFCRECRPRVQGAVEHAAQRGTRLHAQGHGDPDAQLRHALFAVGCRPASRTAGARGACSRSRPLLLAAVHRPVHLQLRLRGQSGNGQRSRQLPAGRSFLEGQGSSRNQEGDPLGDGSRLRALSNAAQERG